MPEIKTEIDPLKPTSAVFIDRDDTIIEDVGYISETEDVNFLPGAAEGLKLLSNAGFKLIVISNQSGLARGIISEDQLSQVNDTFLRMIDDAGIELTDYLYCPYYHDGKVEKFRKDSASRKPSPGMIFHASYRHGIFLPTSWMIGDKDDDIASGQRAGLKTIKIVGADPCVYPKKRSGKSSSNPNFFADNLLKAGRIIFEHIC